MDLARASGEGPTREYEALQRALRGGGADDRDETPPEEAPSEEAPPKEPLR